MGADDELAALGELGLDLVRLLQGLLFGKTRFTVLAALGLDEVPDELVRVKSVEVEDEAVGLERRDVLLAHELEPVGERLEQPVRPDPHRPEALLDALSEGDRLALVKTSAAALKDAAMTARVQAGAIWEQVDKVLALRAELPALRTVIYDDPRGMIHYRDERLVSLDTLANTRIKLTPYEPRIFQAEW